MADDRQMDASLPDSVNPAVPPSSQRRPRFREVSSRFMSPSLKSTALRTPILKPAQASTPRAAAAEPHSTRRRSRSCDSTSRIASPETINRVTPFESIRPESVRSFDNAATPAPRRQLGFRQMDGERGAVHQNRDMKPSVRRIEARTPSMFTPRSKVPSTAFRLLRESSLSLPSGISEDDDDDDDDDDRGSIENVSVSSDLGPSLVKSRVQNYRRGKAVGISGDSPFSGGRRSVDFASSDSEMSPLRRGRVLRENGMSVASDLCSFGVKTSVQCLPPLPPQCARVGVDGKKGKRASGDQEDLHSLILIRNRHLQWRFVNAKSEVCVETRTRQDQKMCISIWIKILNLCESIKSKHMEIQKLRKIVIAYYVLKNQMPYLHEWTSMESEYTNSISQALEDLLNASLMLPLTKNTQADSRSLQDALASATSMMESCILNIRDLSENNQEFGCLASELARVVAAARSFISESGDLLSFTKFLQVEECSLRSHLIQQEAAL